MTEGDKSQIVAELEKHTGGTDKGGTVKNFLNTLAENNRLGILENVCDNFEKLMSAHRGEIELTITSAAVRRKFMPPYLDNRDLIFHRLTLFHLETGRQAYQANRDGCVEVPIQPGKEVESRHKGTFTG